jgi:hypothetical protein
MASHKFEALYTDLWEGIAHPNRETLLDPAIPKLDSLRQNGQLL